jgi:hypothetical protein
VLKPIEDISGDDFSEAFDGTPITLLAGAPLVHRERWPSTMSRAATNSKPPGM